MIIYTLDKKKDRKVKAGEIIGKTFKRNLKSNHYMVKENGYGMQVDVLERLVKEGVEDVALNYKSRRYVSRLQDWALNGKRKDYGHGEQVFLDKSYYKVLKGVNN